MTGTLTVPFALLLALLVSEVRGQVTIRFVEQQKTVSEGDQFTLTVQREGDAQQIINVVVFVDNENQDFVGNSQVLTFFPGRDTVTDSVTFTVADDNQPEIEVTYVFELSVVGDIANVTDSSVALVTITANDDAYGVFGFLDEQQEENVIVGEDNQKFIRVKEQATTTVISISIGRQMGVFGQVLVSFVVESTNPNAEPGSDITPVAGSITFLKGDRDNVLQFQIRADNVPENDEEFYVRLTSATQGARVLDEVFTIIIKANDAPVRFKQGEFRFDEEPTRTVSLTVHRGLEEDGFTVIGSVEESASVNYILTSNTAFIGQDFRGVNVQSTGSVAFAPGQTVTSINVEIIDDNIPEMEESFQIILTSPQEDTILADPSRAVIIINANDNPAGILSFRSPDFVSPPRQQVNEDSNTAMTFVVIRTPRSIGEVTVSWSIFRNDSSTEDVSQDLTPSSGTVTFQNGEEEKTITVSVVNDTIAEPAERFVIRLLADTVTSLATVEGIIYGVIVIEDSENFYGIIDFVQDDSQHKIDVNADPRMLQLTLQRKGANVGDVYVNLTVTYTQAGGTQDVLEETNVATIMFSGETQKVQHIHLLSSAFLQVGGVFSAELTGVSLVTEPSTGAYNTPALGPRTSVNIVVTAEEANGQIGFHTDVPMVVSEPSDSPSVVSLKLTREGTSGDALISWSVQGTGAAANFVTEDDTGPVSGTVTMLSGSMEVDILITIMPDDVPELAEELTITLTGVEPAISQRLKPGASSRKLIISENGNPGGVFQFVESVSSSYTLQESGNPVEFTVERQGGALLEKSIQYNVVPNGEVEFFGATNVLVFPPGVRTQTFSVIAKTDNIPELDETFTLSIQGYGNSSVAIGSKSSIVLVISENEHPYGQLQFRETAIEYIAESKPGQLEVATLAVERRMGTFGSIQVSWTVDPGDEVDLLPSSGFLTFEPNQDVAFFKVESVPDDLTEQSETFIITLSDPQGGAVLGPAYFKTLIIRENDYPLFFTEPNVETEEPSEVTLTLQRDGGTDKPLVIKYRTENSGASSATSDFQAVETGEVTFAVGEDQKSLTVRVLDDGEAEGNEKFFVRVYEIIGDAVMTRSAEATVTILANDQAYGVFRFAAPYQVDVEEGSAAKFYITRAGSGMFGAVRVFIEVYRTVDNLKQMDGDQFVQAEDLYADFGVGESTKDISLTARIDLQPENDITYTVKLTELEVIEGRTDITLASIADQDKEVYVTILASDDPNGRFGFPQTDQDVSLAEDYDLGSSSEGQVALQVERRMGNLGTVQILWEVYSELVAGDLPPMYDLIFLGVIPDTLPLELLARRPHTGTEVVSFPGNTAAFISVPEMHHPTKGEITDGFSISAWVQPLASTNGYIMAKTNTGGSRHFYTLKLVKSNTGTQLVFGYSVTGSNENEFQTIPLLKNIADNLWHHVIATLEMGVMSFYLDGNLQASRSLPAAQQLLDSAGKLTVGAIYPGEEQFGGYLQDVRIYTQPLQEAERKELYETPAAQDVYPISGSITYLTSLREGHIILSSVQDEEEESNEVFTVKIINAHGGASISETDSTATVTVLKSDNANGLFGFAQQCQPTSADIENTTVTCTIERNRGDDGSVMVVWLVYQLIDSQAYIATEDFQDFTGNVVFTPGQRSKTFTVIVKDDSIPEDEEMFEIRLVNVTSDDNLVGSTATSGASIDEANSRSPLTVSRNDHYSGLLQFSMDSVPPSPDDPFIPPLTERPVLRVAEESGLVRLLVVRAQGWTGDITVEWRTTDGTARSSGKVPLDYQAGVGRLSFADGQRYGYINIAILDNDIPEDEKFFIVTLLNPSGGATLGPGSSIQVIINYSDGAFGVFQFDDTSLGVQALEEGDSGFNTVDLQVTRIGGNIGQVDVTWELLSDQNNDLVDKTGNVTFSDKQLTASLSLKIRGDTVAELDELFMIELTAVSRGELGESRKLRSEVTILANDGPYGVFIVPESQRPITVDEENTVVTMTIQRLFGTFGRVEVNFTTLLPTETYPFIPNTVPRSDFQDYIMTAGSVVFSPGDTTATFDVSILDDVEPEEAEAVFVRLTGVELIEGAQIRPVDSSPRLGVDSETYGQIVINNNDNANGELQLSPSSVTVMENSTGAGVNVVRYGGAFGEVTVSFLVTEGKARQGLDYLVLSTQVTLYRGDKEVALPIQIVDDNIPEESEMFTIQLDQVSGGGVLGTVTSATVTIASSDDPYGAFGFFESGRSIEEPEDQPLNVDITVFRSGGTLGVVTVDWVATLDGASANSEITQTSGSVFFVSNEASRQITLTVIPDDIPEGQEDIKITLTRATNGGRVGDNNVFILSILSNDNPHGVVQFTSSTYVVEEEAVNTVVQLGLTRTGGSFGQLRVYYSTEVLTTVSETPGVVPNVLEFFSLPQVGSRSATGEAIDILGGQDPTERCAQACLDRIACLSFEVYLESGSETCTLYNYIIDQAQIIDNAIFYYIKDEIKAGELTGLQATPGEDYSVVTNGYVILEENMMEGFVPVSILADTVPELDEKFLVRLVQVEVDGAPPAPKNSPFLGEIRNATVTILNNDDTYGVFRLYSSSPSAINDGHVILVEEKRQLAVDLIVEREGGTIGEVSVVWSVDREKSTAVYGEDFVADGATLTFVPGETRKLITVTILDDDIPEDRKLVVVQLTNNIGGADVSNGTATIVILENDYVAGILSLSSTSILAEEGDTVQVNVTRTAPGLGTVNVDWYIQGTGSFDPAAGFQSYQGSLEFLPGDLVKTITLVVLADDTPEANEEYQLTLANVQTVGVGSSGAAVLNQLSRTASITIEGSNDPHGVIQFAENTQNVRVFESDGIVDITVVRKFGAIGTVRVQYEITVGSVSVTSDELVPATANADFVALQSYVEIGDGASSTTIRLQILEDEVPEVDEVFVVRLLAVSLMNPGTSSLTPSLASSGTVAQVIINANDGTKGVAIFAPDSANVEVDEISKNISLTVVRERGMFGEVSVFFYAQSVVEGTNLGLDYRIEPEEIVFLNGEDRKQIVVEIINDDIPEPDEIFQVILSNPKGGLELGIPSRANVTILASDDASGFVYFEEREVINLEEPGGDNLVSSTAEVTVLRGPGMYGVVNVPFAVIPELLENRQDLSPMQGSITFKDRQTSAQLTISVLDDDIPEDAERFIIQLLDPDNTAQLGTRTQQNLVIFPNDSPNGLFNLYSAETRLREISVEEGTEVLHFEIIRSQGLEGQVTVDIATEPGTALSTADVSSVSLVPVQMLDTSNVGGWYSYEVNNTVYLLMLKSNIVGELTSSVGTDGSDGMVDNNNLMKTTLFTWQGELLPLQTVQTDGGSAAAMYMINSVPYLFITNIGNHNRYQTKSRLYEIQEDGTLLVIQDIPTKGAKDAALFSANGNVFLVIANSIDNAGNTQLDSDIYRWDSSTMKFTKVLALTTLGASSLTVFELESSLYLAVANNYDSDRLTYQVESKIYKFGENSQFSQHQSITTRGAVDVKHTQIQDLHILVFANNRENTISSPQLSDVYKWNRDKQMFELHQQLETSRVEMVEIFSAYDDTVYMMFANSIGSSAMYAWDVQANRFISAWTGSPAVGIHPITVSQMSGQLDLVAVASKNITEQPVIYQLIKVKDSDFAPRTITMTFDPKQTLLRMTIVVLQDTIPEDTETFYVTIRNPEGGAEIGPNNRITINILSNDNAHGVLEFAPDSLEIRAQELENRDNNIQINVIRHQGYFGLVSVGWRATGDHDGTNDISPVEGTVEFSTGQSVATISLTIIDDDVAELQEVTYIHLTEIVEAGTSLPGRGAQIGMNKTAKVVVLANDSPYGVVRWEKMTLSTVEPEGTDSTIVFFILREQGMMGELQVSYTTSTNHNSARDRQAVSGVDYISRQGMVIIQENVARAPVEIVIKQDAVPEAAETFLVSITRVVLIGDSPIGGAEPSVRIPGNIIKITIAENDNARGIIQFNVTTNIEGRIDVYEEYGLNTTVSLQVSRTVGFFGAVTVTWQADPREATVLDFYPSSGTLSLAETQDSASIYITIIDDNIAEDMETFDVKLISVTGGALLGPYNTVRIAILKNDSPNGLFRFVTTEAVVRESLTDTDPDGEVQLIIERIQGTEGVVQVQWRLNAEAVYDFFEPHTGTLLFAQGERTKSLLLRTKPDDILEGQERFRVSLITADNNADISHSQGDASIIVLPDPGASGTVSVVPEYRSVYIGEPGESDPSYNGKTQIVLTRGDGIYGDIAVSWSITPRDESAFIQVEGSVSFVDLQQKATIVIQALDDTQSELRTVYTLQLNSATGGALLSQVTRAITSDITFVASDHPHGVFVFDLPPFIITTEDQYSVTVPVTRTSGLNGQVLVSYSTSPGTATRHEDYFPVEGTLTFQHGENRQIVEIKLKEDDLPEGLETFYLNLTSARLRVPNNNDYNEVDGLQLDMPPSIGSLDVKEIRIEKNDNAEGTIQFEARAIQFTVTEEAGVARIPVERLAGNFGRVSVTYVTFNRTATQNVDYVVPDGEAVFEDGMRYTTINITIRDDSEMESSEEFDVQLTGTTGGARLGDITMATVTIAKSDYPNGRFGFKGDLVITSPNRIDLYQRMFSIERSAGLKGQQTVFWRILGPNNPGAVLQETNDIAYRTNGIEVTQGSLLWEDGQGGERTFSLDIKPYSNWEIEKVFIIHIYQVQGFPLDVGDGEVSPTAGNVTLTISKYGHPNGIVRFDGPAQSLQETEEPDGISTLTLQLSVYRHQGAVGNIEVFWEILGPFDDVPDFEPRNGSVLIPHEERYGNIVLEILPDDLPELTEQYSVVLQNVGGGAEIDKEFNVSVFRIRYNDQPHGMFGVIPEYQSVIVDPVELTRHVRLNFTRYAGTFGRIILTFSIKYDLPQSGLVLSISDGTVQFDQGEENKIVDIGIEGTGFLEIGTTFSVSLLQVQYLGSGATDPPKFMAGQTEVKVTVPALAANSKVGFLSDQASVDEETSTTTLTLVREGTYGTLEVPWQGGFKEGDLPDGFSAGIIKPVSGSVIIQHGIATKNFTVVLQAKLDVAELFALHLATAPSTTVPGGARLQPDKTLVKVEPHGVLRFADNSTTPTVSEMFGQVYLQVVRVYGSQGKIEGHYRAVGVTAEADFDYVTIENHAVVMEPGQTSGLIVIQVVQDNRPEQEETFFVNLTAVEKFPTETTPSISPRLSFIHGSSVVTIQESNDPYGILCLEPQTVYVEERYQDVNLTVRRTGGIFGTISALVRTVGGGESWTNLIVPKPGATTNNTITEILGVRDRFTAATGGLDYEVLNTKVEFLQGETEKTVTVTILADEMAEPDETVLVYLTEVKGGARVAAGEPDGGKKGFAVIIVAQNDLSNGIIGFSEDSKSITADEDQSPVVSLKLTRTDAFFGEIEVSWLAKVSETSDETEDVVLAAQLEKTAGTAICPGRQPECFFNISLKNDQLPEEEHQFVVKLVSVRNDAKLDVDSLYARITVLASDFIRGLIEFTQDSRVVVTSNSDRSVRLKVNRVKGQKYRVEVSFRTMQVTSQDSSSDYGVVIYPALEGEDYDGQTGTLVFQPDRQEIEYVEINLTPDQASSNPYPKQFFIVLRNPTNGASLNAEASTATVIVVEKKDEEIWKIITDTTDLLDISDIISKLDTLIQTTDYMTEDEVTLVENMINTILDEGLKRKLPNQDINRLMNVMCKMLSPDKNDATRGRFSLAEIMERIAYMMLTEAPCPTPSPPDMTSMQCAHAKVSAGRWPLGRIQGFQYAAQRQDVFTVPDMIPDAPATGESECLDFHMIEYTSEQWFMRSDEKQLLSNKIIAFGVKGRPSSYTDDPATFKIHSPDRRIATRQAQCVYFDKALKDWVGEVCQVTNDLDLGVDDFVDCSCKHLTHYGVRATTTDPGLAGYSIWFFISCFICMTGLLLAILAHHLCSISAMFSASLLMHLCFACMATQICYVVAAYLSPDEIIMYSLEEDNYRCIVMGLFLHYFFLTQFCWMMTQAVNFWKILVLNDEHTDRKYVLFFLLGWGLPVLILAIFYVVVFNLYKYVYDMPYDFIYGDVNNNGAMCFITNPYAALGGVIVPVLLMLVVVAVVFVKAFQVTPQWQAYDDIYRGRYNIREVRTLLLFWAVIILTWLWGGLHMVYGHLWMLIIFCIFNIIQGLMALILYGLLRNPCLIQCFAPQKASSYAVNATILDPAHPLPHHPSGAGQYQFHPATLDVGSLKGSRASLLNESWERDSLPSRPSTMKVKRTLPSSGNIYVDPPVLQQGAESDTKDFDDLLYALKTGGSFTPSDVNSMDSDKLSDISSKVDKYELRRIDIADTHL